MYDNSRLQVQQIANLPGQMQALRLPVFDIEVRAQRENAYTKMSQNELALQFWSIGALNPQMTDQALILLDMMDFRGKDELIRKIRAQGTMMDTIQKIAQIALQLAQKYEPATAQQLAMVLQGVAEETGMMQLGAQAQMEAGKKGAIAGQIAPADEMSQPREANENGIVRNARERAANASRPN